MSLETLSPADVAALLGEEEHTPEWVKRTVNRGGHEYLRVGRSMRFTPDQAEAFIRSFTVHPDGGSSKHDDEKDPLRSQTSKSKSRRKNTAA